jgi:hypothetical protein
MEKKTEIMRSCNLQILVSLQIILEKYFYLVMLELIAAEGGHTGNDATHADDDCQNAEIVEL